MSRQALREFYAMDHAMVFSTGYQANLGIISTIAGKGDYIVLDIDSHASIWDGCALGNAEVVPFKHNDIEAMDKRLRRIPEGAGKLVILEGVYSMLGDIAPLKEMVAVAKEHGAMVLVDEAHSMGFIGEHGRGVAEEQGVHRRRRLHHRHLLQDGRHGRRLLRLQPPEVRDPAAGLPPLRVHRQPAAERGRDRRDLDPQADARAATSARTCGRTSKRLHAGLRQLGFTLGTEEPQSAIIAVIMPDLERGAAMWEALLKEGLYVNLARPPATPANMTLLRCSLCAEHTERAGRRDPRHVRSRRPRDRGHRRPSAASRTRRPHRPAAGEPGATDRHRSPCSPPGPRLRAP